MFDKLVKEIQSGGSFDINTLAQRLDTTPELVKLMLEQLQKMGHIKAYEACTSSCDHCGLKSSCSSPAGSKRITLWQS
jgi:hypothetical protein